MTAHLRGSGALTTGRRVSLGRALAFMVAITCLEGCENAGSSTDAGAEADAAFDAGATDASMSGCVSGRFGSSTFGSACFQ